MHVKKTGKWMERLLQSPTRAIALSFAALIFVGTVLLALPAASASGNSIGAFDALFTATSAVCVTGLVVLNTSADFSRFGHVVLMLLIQCGGLGLMTIATLLFMLLGRKITLRERMLIQESMNENGPGGMVRLIRWVAVSTFTMEFVGAALLAIRTIPQYGPGDGIFFAIFHAVSAFCNAGFDLFGNSLVQYATDPLMNLVVLLLIVFGGLGFGVISDVVKSRSFKQWKLQTKLVICVTLFLILTGCVGFLAFEWNNAGTLAGMTVPGKILTSLFQSVTFRTAGFNSIEMAEMRPATKLLACMLMFVGAAPASTGGGVKVTTMAVLFCMVASTARGSEEATAFHRTISRSAIRRAIVIVTIGMAVLLTDLIALCLLESDYAVIDLAFECASALGTVGVSSIGTANLCAASRTLIILAMFIGRVGPLSMALAMSRRQAAGRESIRYPEERIMIG